MRRRSDTDAQLTLALGAPRTRPNRLERRDATRNMARYYEVSLRPTLFGDVALVREWGRIGVSRRRLEQWHDALDAAMAAMAEIEAAKRRRGYVGAVSAAHDAKIRRARRAAAVASELDALHLPF